MGLAHLFLVKKYIRLLVDGGRRLCQYNEDDFLIKFKLLTRFFSNYKFTSILREKVLHGSFS